METLDVIKSKVDKTVKFIFQLDDSLIMEMAYIDNDTGKDIICVSTQTSCSMGCLFCHISDYRKKLKLRNISYKELVEGIYYIIDYMSLQDNKRKLLISYMGCGEPLINYENVIISMYHFKKDFENVRFAISTLIPKSNWINFLNLTEKIKNFEIPLKIHLSLHSPFDDTRQKWMPNALDIMPSINLLKFYKSFTNNPVEFHYTPIKGVNDREIDINTLCNILSVNNIPIKFLKFNEKPTLKVKMGNIPTEEFDKRLIKYEFYTPPGLDIGASCGQFLFDYYLKYNKI